MALVDHFVDALGEPLLVPGPALDADNELFEPYVVHFDEVCAVLGGSAARRHLLSHLDGLLLWLERAGQGRVRAWVRGELVATMRETPNGLDVVAIAPRDCMAVGDRWVARMLSTRLRVPGLGELVFDMVSADDDEDVTTERRRSARRCRDTEGDPVVTGWLEVTL
jgi:hypothetical protein